MREPTNEQKDIIRNVGARARRRGIKAQDRAERLFASQLAGEKPILADLRSRRAVETATRELKIASNVDKLVEAWEKSE